MPQTSLNPQSGVFGGQKINNNNSHSDSNTGSGSSCDSNDLSSSPRDREENGIVVDVKRRREEQQQQSERPASCIISGNNLVNQQYLPTKFTGAALIDHHHQHRKDLDSVLSLTGGFHRSFREHRDHLHIQQQQHQQQLQSLLQADPYNNVLVNGLDALRQEARWPIECQVLPDRVRHIDYSPAEPEPFNVPTGREPRPKPVGEDMGTVIFRYCPATSTNYFSRSCIGGSAALERTAADQSSTATTNVNNQTATDETILSPPPQPQQSNDLCFESRFESGNLGKVIKITDTYYQLHLRKDLYTQRHMQWYYFRITNTRSGVLYRLSIVNLCKEDSLYNEGLRPLCYSVKAAKLNSVGWRRCGENICYYKNDGCGSDSDQQDQKERHTLTFNIRFEHDQDTVYIAHSYPYTYSDLQDYLAGIAGDPLKTRFTKLRLLCRTLAGNGVYYLTITAPPVNDNSEASSGTAFRRKKGIVITARVHPGETPSSWIMKGICDFLTGESNQARELRERFIFKLVPMLNPDGVIVGNNRCSLSGKDLNRQYRTVLRESYPSVWHTKLMIRRLMEDCGIAMYCDLHAHSRKHNVFIYGCESKRPGCGPREGRLAEQVFPLMLHKNAADKFSFENCKFHIEKGKEGTGRVVVWLMGIQNSYTMEASLGGSVLGSRNGTHFSCQDYEQIGKAFCETLLDFSDSDPLKERLRSKIIARLIKEGSSADEPTNIELTDYSSDEGDTSDSSSEEDRYTASEMLRRRLNSCEEYLAAPPPSPLLLKPATAESYGSNKRQSKSKNKLPKIVLMRRKAMRGRKTLDLPTTDPGSDLYELSDSADETTRLKVKSSDEEERLIELIEKENRRRKQAEELELPQIPRPRSVSLGEDIIGADLDKKTRRLRHRRIPMPLRNLSPTTQDNGQAMKVKLMPLRQNYWTGVTNCDWENEENLNYLQRNDCPLSWGVSKMAFEYQSDSEALLLSCSRKLEELSYMQSDYKKTKKKTRRKPSKILDASTVINPLDEKNQSNNKKKKPKVKKPKNVKSGVESLDNDIVLVTNELDTLKLFGTAKLPKVNSKQKSESKKKLNKNITATIATSKLLSNKVSKDSIGDSSTSDNIMVALKQKSNGTQKKINNTTGKKRAQSAVVFKKEAK
ncbi:hypothetical protein TKK_0004371 [Trichogramma kaykai]|uniref:Peptidase M14 domain-containing protein n=1 Tax=Trichogramma kaykai TaxID=54128 RepID=A0ABD2XM10_9HYME